MGSIQHLFDEVLFVACRSVLLPFVPHRDLATELLNGLHHLLRLGLETLALLAPVIGADTDQSGESKFLRHGLLDLFPLTAMKKEVVYLLTNNPVLICCQGLASFALLSAI